MPLFGEKEDEDDWGERIETAEKFAETARKPEFQIDTNKVLDGLKSIIPDAFTQDQTDEPYILTRFDEKHGTTSFSYEFGVQSRNGFKYEAHPFLIISLEHNEKDGFFARVKINNQFREYHHQIEALVSDVLPNVYNLVYLEFFGKSKFDEVKDNLKDHLRM